MEIRAERRKPNPSIDEYGMMRFCQGFLQGIPEEEVNNHNRFDELVELNMVRQLQNMNPPITIYEKSTGRVY